MNKYGWYEAEINHIHWTLTEMFSIKNELSLDFFHMNYRHSVGRNMECDVFETVKGDGIYSLNILK